MKDSQKSLSEIAKWCNLHDWCDEVHIKGIGLEITTYVEGKLYFDTLASLREWAGY